jgi:hypothetical protein
VPENGTFPQKFLDVEHLKIVIDRFGGSWYTCIIRKGKEHENDKN